MGFQVKLPHVNVSVTRLVVKDKPIARDTSAEPLVGPTHIPLPFSSSHTSMDSPPPPLMIETKPPSRPRKFSLRTLSFVPRKHRDHVEQKHKMTHVLLPNKLKGEATTSVQKYRITKPVTSRSEKRAKASALALRSLIIGSPSCPQPGSKPNKDAKQVLSKVKSDLIKPSSANKVIAQLRVLPATEEEDQTVLEDGGVKPIHAVCLEHTETEEEELKFKGKASSIVSSAEEFYGLLEGMKLIDLIKVPDFGLGQPVDGDGLLAGALPTPEAVLTGFKRITPELMALGYASSKAVYPDHTGVYPPTDRMSILTYWWGLEICLPPPSIAYLTRTHSISNSVMNFLSAVALINQGVREILPFIRYISQYIDFEFNYIKAQDQGLGVVCAATWIMPAAMVPRPWDFPARTPEKSKADTPEKHNTGDDQPPSPVPLPPSPPLGIGLPTQPDIQLA